MCIRDRYQIQVYGSNGKLRSIIRRAWTPTPITADDWERWVVEWSKLWVRTTGAERERDIQKVRESPWAEENPAFSQFIVDRGGRLWAVSYTHLTLLTSDVVWISVVAVSLK